MNSLYLTDGYKIGHKKMLAKNTTRLYGTWIPRSVKHAPKYIDRIVSFGQQMTWKYIHQDFIDNFFSKDRSTAMEFVEDLKEYLGLEYDGKHFEELHNLGYLPIKVQSLPEGVETLPNIPHMTFINTTDGFAWLTLYLETIISSSAWKAPTSATIALQYRRNVEKWINKTDKDSNFLIPFLCHDFSARGLSPFDMWTSGLGHATCFRGSDTLAVIPASRKYYNEKNVCINSVNASEHSVSCVKIFSEMDKYSKVEEEYDESTEEKMALSEQQMLSDWLTEFPTGILSVVSDTFDLWQFLTEYLPNLKDQIMGRDGKLVIRPDSGDPVDIICGTTYTHLGQYIGKNSKDYIYGEDDTTQAKGVIELLWDIFGGTVNEQGYKVLDSHIGCIYGDSITLDRQLEIYKRLEAKGFAATNIVLGIGSYTYQYNTRDTFGFAAKGAWFETKESPTGRNMENEYVVKTFDIFKDPVTDDGTKKSLKGFQYVYKDNGEYKVKSEVSESEAYSDTNELRVIYENGRFYNETSLTKIRELINDII